MVNYVKSKLFAVACDRKGISALEYAILAAGVLGIIGTAVGVMGTDIGLLFTKVENTLTTAAG